MASNNREDGMTQVREDIKIDSEFAALIPPLSREERQQLEDNIVEHGGARDPLVLWVPSEWTPEGCGEPLRFEDGEPFRADSESEETLVWYGDDDDSYFVEDWTVTLLDGHNRYEICTRLGLPFDIERLPFPDRSHAEEWIIRNQFGRRNLSAYVRTQLALRLEETISKRSRQGNRTDLSQKSVKSLPPLDTQKEVAKAANVSHDTVAKVKRIEEATTDGLVSDETISKLRSGEISINHVDKEIKKQRAEVRAVEKKKEAAAAGCLDGEIVRLGDFRTILPSIPGGCVDLIFTDPPYDKATVPLYEDMAREAARILRPGGSLICYLGQYATADVCERVSRHLQFYWTLCCYHEGPGQAMAMRGIRAKWKPMLWFVNGTGRFDTGAMVEDLVVSHKEKSSHPWQQSVVEASYYIEKLTPAGGLVVDPFCGGGTTALAAKQTGRKWITCELDSEYAAIATQRIKEWNE
jgi:16S rRNA G966 N2-methylase RsmD